MKNLLRIISAVFLAALIIAAGNRASSGNYLSGRVAYAQDGSPQDGGDGPRRPPPTPWPTIRTPPGPVYLIDVGAEAAISTSAQSNTGGGLLSQMWDWFTGWF